MGPVWVVKNADLQVFGGGGLCVAPPVRPGLPVRPSGGCVLLVVVVFLALPAARRFCLRSPMWKQLRGGKDCMCVVCVASGLCGICNV